MMNLPKLFITKGLMCCVFAFSQVWAADATPSTSGPDIAKLKKEWTELLQGAEISKVQPAPIEGLWEVDTGSHIFYANQQGDKLIFGDILALKADGYVNLTEESRKALRLTILKDLDKNDMITFKAKKPKHEIYVFTDPDCGYCRKFHEERETLSEGGITIHYLAMPRTPKGTPSYNKSVSIWCAADRQQALTEAKNDKFEDQEKICPEGEKIVAENVKLASQFGAQGTPTIVLENGEVIPGYIPADKLIEYYAKQTTASAG